MGKLLPVVRVDGEYYSYLASGDWGIAQNSETGHSSYVNSVAISPDGQTLASGSGSYDNTIRIWHLATGELLRTLKGTYVLLPSPSAQMGKLLSVGVRWDKTIRIWHLATGELLRTLRQGIQVMLIQSPSARMGKLLSVGVMTKPSKFGIL